MHFQSTPAEPIGVLMGIVPPRLRQRLLWTAAMLALAGIAAHAVGSRRAVSTERVYRMGCSHNPPYQIGALLEKDRHDVTLVASGHEAGEAVRGPTPFDLVLMDIQMPELDGFQATAAIRAMPGPGQAVPIVALTAHAQVGYEDVCRSGGYERLPEQADRSYRAASRARPGRRRHLAVRYGQCRVSPPQRAAGAGSMLRIAAIFQAAPSFTSSHEAHIRRVVPSAWAMS